VGSTAPELQPDLVLSPGLPSEWEDLERKRLRLAAQ
jgi:hypothetical protein